MVAITERSANLFREKSRMIAAPAARQEPNRSGVAGRKGVWGK